MGWCSAVWCSVVVVRHSLNLDRVSCASANRYLFRAERMVSDKLCLEPAWHQPDSAPPLAMVLVDGCTLPPGVVQEDGATPPGPLSIGN